MAGTTLLLSNREKRLHSADIHVESNDLNQKVSLQHNNRLIGDKTGGIKPEKGICVRIILLLLY